MTHPSKGLSPQAPDETDVQLIIRQMNEIGRLAKLNAELLEALKFVKAFFQKLENDMDDDDPLKAIRRHYHAPIHAKIDPAIRKAEGGQ